MTISAHDQVLQRARAKEKRIETALAAIDELNDDEAEFVYAKLEKRVVNKQSGISQRAKATSKTDNKPVAAKGTNAKAKESTADGRRHCSFCGEAGHYIQSCEEKKAAEINGETPKKTSTKPGPKPGTSSTRPNYAALAREVLAANPQGLRAYEIGKKIGQNKVQNAFGTLKLLERLGYAERHGDRYNALWTVPGFTPVPRVETIGAAIVHILQGATSPMDAWKLRDEVVKLIIANTNKKPRLDSVTTEIGSLMQKNLIDTDGLNEHGPLYVIAGGGVSAPTLN
jgi:hypothetical protein